MVRVHFTASHGNGNPIATTVGEDPLELTIGDGKLIACFEESIIGMEEGQQKTRPHRTGAGPWRKTAGVDFKPSPTPGTRAGRRPQGWQQRCGQGQ